MDIKTVTAFANLMEEKMLTCLEITDGETKISMKRGGEALQPILPQIAPTAEAFATADETASAPTGKEIASPLVGMAYFAPSPDAAPFVSLGDKVKKGQVLCIIEAMKVMNEFAAPENGEIVEICFEDGALVEFGQPLFRFS